MASSFKLPISLQVAAAKLGLALTPLFKEPARIEQAFTYVDGYPVPRYQTIDQITVATQRLTWTPDPWDGKLDVIKHPTFMQRAIEQRLKHSGDCLPSGTLLLTDKFDFKPIETVQRGDRIWGLDNWTTVEDVWAKGNLPVTEIQLNNGSSFKCTEDHKVYVAFCNHHSNDNCKRPCSCALSERKIQRIKTSELKEGMVLVTPQRIAEGSGKLEPRRAYIEGLYLSDGWCSHTSDFDIAGLDGHPKEGQKHNVEQICFELGIATTWFRKSIRIRDIDWAQRVAQMGHHAKEKHALSIDLTKDSAAELFKGIMADSGHNSSGYGRTFTTTSRTLFLQTRVLAKMLGFDCGASYIEDHGGLGENPIWRLNVRSKQTKLLRVKSISRNVEESQVWDISTSDHYVYLPEADVTVSNCDDFAAYWCVALVKSSLAREVYFGSTQWVDEQANELTGHAVCIFKGMDNAWYYAGNWNNCVPIPISSSFDWVRDIGERASTEPFMAVMYAARRDSSDTMLLGKATIVKR